MHGLPWKYDNKGFYMFINLETWLYKYKMSPPLDIFKKRKDVAKNRKEIIFPQHQ